MSDFTELLKTIKFPTLSASAILLWFGKALIEIPTNETVSTQLVAGMVLLTGGFILMLLTFLDFRYKNAMEDVIENQGKAITKLSGLVNSISKTKNLDERANQKTIASSMDEGELGGRGKQEYKMEKDESTPTA